MHAAIGAPTHCGAPHTCGYEKPRTIISKLKEEFHTLFIKILNMILELDSQGNKDLAIRLMGKLENALRKYPGLCDDQKRGALSDMAAFYKENGEQDEYEDVLGMIADMTDHPVLPIDEDQDPCYLLAMAFLESETEGLTKFWVKHFAKSNMPSDPAVPQLQRAAQHRNPKIAEIILSRQQRINTAPAIFNLESVNIAAALGNVDTLSTLIEIVGVENVDARDVQVRHLSSWLPLTVIWIVACYCSNTKPISTLGIATGIPFPKLQLRVGM